MHRMPQIGELGPGVWLASGFGGHGLNTTAMAGNLIARAIVEGDQTWRQFTPFELVWAGGVFGRIAAQLRVWIKRLRDGIEEGRAKAREVAHRQAREAEMALAAEQARMERVAASQHVTVPEAATPPAADVKVAKDSAAVLAAYVAAQEGAAAAVAVPASIIPPRDDVDEATRPPSQPQDGDSAARRPKRRKRRQSAKQAADQGAKV